MRFAAPDSRDRDTGALAPSGQSIAPDLSGSAADAFAPAAIGHQPFSGRQNAEFCVSSQASLLHTDRWEAVGGRKDRGRADGKGPAKESSVSADRRAEEFERGASVRLALPRGKDCVRSPSLADGATGTLSLRVPTHGAGGPRSAGGLSTSGPAAGAARRCSSPATPSIATTPRTSGLAQPSRAAVIGAIARADASPQGAATPCGLTANPAHNPHPSAGSGAARPADVPALFTVSASRSTGGPGTTDRLTSLAHAARTTTFVSSNHQSPLSVGEGLTQFHPPQER
jgi:hypothetical protein